MVVLILCESVFYVDVRVRTHALLFMERTYELFLFSADNPAKIVELPALPFVVEAKADYFAQWRHIYF